MSGEFSWGNRWGGSQGLGTGWGRLVQASWPVPDEGSGFFFLFL